MRGTGLADVLRDVGCTVREVDGWKTRGRDMHDIAAVMWHHTATSPSVSDSSVVRVLRDGRAGIPGPLAQTGVARDGTWWIVAAGRANHAGTGSWPGLAGNDDTLGVEAFHTGTSAEKWDARQLRSLRLGTAAICRAWGIDPDRRLIAHREWAPDRKIDPHGLDMRAERAGIAASPVFHVNAAPLGVEAGYSSRVLTLNNRVIRESNGIVVIRLNVTAFTSGGRFAIQGRYSTAKS